MRSRILSSGILPKPAFTLSAMCSGRAVAGITHVTAGWLTMIAEYQPSSVDVLAMRQILRLLTPEKEVEVARVEVGERRLVHPSSLTLISLAGDDRAHALGPQIAAFAAACGVSTRLIVGRSHESAAALFAACTPERRPAADIARMHIPPCRRSRRRRGWPPGDCRRFAPCKRSPACTARPSGQGDGPVRQPAVCGMTAARRKWLFER